METWRTCSSCKKPIGYGQPYKVCSVSTCNRARTGYVFCSTACWDAHVPVMNHRESWCGEARAPRTAEPMVQSLPRQEPPPPADPRRRIAPSAPVAPREPDEVLIVASRLKDYIAAKADLNTSADVREALSDIVRSFTDDAIIRARAEGRKTVKGRDFRPS